MRKRQKNLNSVVSSSNQKEKNVRDLREVQIWNSKERRTSFSQSFRAIRPSKFVGTRRKTALRGEGFAWIPNLRSFDKLREVGVSPYLGFILRLSTL